MSENSGALKPEDYLEPNCVLCGDPYGMVPEAKRVPLQRIIEKLDEYQSRKDSAGAKRHLLYWLDEAKLGWDLRGQLAIRNELIGFCRKNNEREEAFQNIEEAVKLVEELEFDGTVSSGTTYTNAATAYYTFGEYETSLFWFEKAKAVYESNSGTDAALLGGLYNNMGLTYTALKRYEKAAELYRKALDIMENVEEGAPERAITCLNLANAVEAQLGMENAESEIFALLDRSEALLNEAWEEYKNRTRNEKGYYAFVCESCAPTFSYYGFFMTAAELNRRAKEIYEGNGAG